MSAWDLTRRAADKAVVEPTMKPQMSHNQQLEAPPDPLNLWQSLITSDERLKALLAQAASQQQTQPDSGATTLVQSLPFLYAASQQQLKQQKYSPAANHEADTTATTTSDNNNNIAMITMQHQQLHLHHNQAASLSSRSLTPSPTGSDLSRCSNSTERIDLSLSNRLILPPMPISSTSSPFSSLASSSDGESISFSSMQHHLLLGADQKQFSSSPISDSSGLDMMPDRRARKKDQNRRAAFNYRRKKMEERDKMIEEEARLVHKHVRLAGKIARIEEKILSILGTSTRRNLTLNREGPTTKVTCYVCPVCCKSCDTVPMLRNHLKTQHLPNLTTLLDTPISATSQTNCASTVLESRHSMKVMMRRQNINSMKSDQYNDNKRDPSLKFDDDCDKDDNIMKSNHLDLYEARNFDKLVDADSIDNDDVDNESYEDDHDDNNNNSDNL